MVWRGPSTYAAQDVNAPRWKIPLKVKRAVYRSRPPLITDLDLVAKTHVR